MSLFDKLKNKRSSLQEKKDDTTGRGKKPIKVNLKNLVDKAKKNPLNKNLGVKITDTDTNTIKQSEISKQAKKFTKKINKKNINRPEGVIGDTYVSTDKKGNIRDAKKVNPTLKKSVSQVKGDIEFKQGLQKVRKFAGQKGTGELSDKAPQKVRKFVKDTRAQKIKDLKLPDTSFKAKTKFSQKGFEKSLKTSTKGPKTGIVDPFKGSAITKGQANVKGLESKAFKKTKPSDIKLPQSSINFDRIKKEYRADAAKTSSSTPRKITKKFTPTVGVKQAEVSKQAKDFTKAIDKARTKTPVTSSKTFSKFAKEAETAKNKFRKQVDTIVKNPKLTGSEKAKQSRPVMKKVTGAAEVEKGYKLASKGKGTPGVTPIVKSSNLDLVKGTKPTATVGGKSKGTTPVKVKIDTSVETRTPRTITKQTKALMSKQQTFAKSAVGKGLKKNLPTVYKAAIKNPIARTVVKKGGLPAVVGLGLLSSPTVRKGIKYALAGGTIGAFAGNKDKKAVLGPKTSGKPVKFNLSPAAKSNSNKSKYTAGVYGRPKAYS